VRTAVLVLLAFALGAAAGYALGAWANPPPKLPPSMLDLSIVDGGT